MNPQKALVDKMMENGKWDIYQEKYVSAFKNAVKIVKRFGDNPFTSAFSSEANTRAYVRQVCRALR